MNNDTTIDHYVSSSEGVRFSAEDMPKFRNSAIMEDQRVFDRAIYAQEIHPPIPVLPTGNLLEQEGLRCLDMPIRLKGDHKYAIPEEWTFLEPLIQQIVSIEHGSNPNAIDDYFTYMTFDSSVVRRADQQRHGGLHVDGFQGARIQPKTKITRNYVASSNGGTTFYPQLFDASLDDTKYNIFRGFDLQGKLMHTAPERTVVFMDAYTVHESGYAVRDGVRNFLRVTFDCKEFDRLGNTHNGMLDYSWDMIHRTTQDELIDPTLADVNPPR